MAGHGFENRAPRGSLRRRSRSQYRKSGIANRPAIFPRSPIAAETAVLAPNSESVWRGECTNASLPSPPPAASSRPTKATAAPATDRTTTDNQNENGAQAPTSQCRFPRSLQRAGTGIGNSGQVGTAGPHASPSNALKTGPSNCVIVLSAAHQIVEEQTSDDPKIKKALAKASKSGEGMGKPEFIVRLKDDPDFLIVFEC